MASRYLKFPGSRKVNTKRHLKFFLTACFRNSKNIYFYLLFFYERETLKRSNSNKMENLFISITLIFKMTFDYFASAHTFGSKSWNKRLKSSLMWDRVFKTGPSKICRRQPLKNLKLNRHFVPYVRLT